MYGMPNLLNKLPRAAGLTLLSNSVNALYDYFVQPPRWGVYKPGTSDPATQISSIVELGASGESVASDYPLETGSFVSYNKVRRPGVFGIRVTHDGPIEARAVFLQWLETAKDEPSLFDIACPEHTWLNATLLNYRIARAAGSGASMITADLVFQQILEKPARYESSKVASAGDQNQAPTIRVSAVPNPPNIPVEKIPVVSP